MNDTIIKLEAISHSYQDKEVLRNIDLSIESGSIYGLLGRNSAGKSTMLRIIMGLRKSSSGRSMLWGKEKQALNTSELEKIGYVPEVQDLPNMLSTEEIIHWSSALRPSWDHDFAKELILEGDLDLKTRIINLSQGKQRYLSFILAAAFRPKILICDEPAANLDPVIKRALSNRLLELSRDSNTTIILSSHQLNDVERVATHIGILANKELAINSSLDDLKSEHKQNLEELFIELNQKTILQ